MKRPQMFAVGLVMLGVSLAGASGARAESAEAAATRAQIGKTFGFVPGFLKQMPDPILPGFWQEMTGLEMNSATALPGKVKELIGVAVASQIPCDYCVHAHTQFAGVNDASQARGKTTP